MNLRKMLHCLWLSILISGCVASTSAVMLDPSMKYLPTNNVQILSAQPERPYKTIAILETIGNQNVLIPDLLENMRQKAQEIGADAIIPIGEASQEQPQGLMYNPWLGGYQTVGGGFIPKVRGLAIKYE